MKKRGVSPLVATILIIALTIIISVFVFVWGADIFSSYKEKTTQESKVSLACAQTFFNVKTACFLGGNLNLYIENTGQQDISDFLYRFKGKEIKPKYLGKSLSQYSTLLTSSLITESKELLDEIELYPNITIEGTSYTCEQPVKNELRDCISLLGLKNANDFMINEGGGWTTVKEDCSTTEKVCVNILTKDNTKELESLLGASFQTDLQLGEFSVIIYPKDVTSPYSVAVKSVTYPSQKDDQKKNFKITHIGLYGETMNMGAVFSIVNENKGEGEEMEFVSTLSEDTNSFVYRKSIEEWKGDDAHLEIEVNGNGIGYATIFRFCYTDENGICLI